MKILKQSTAVTLLLGPFVDDTDGKTAETGLTISQSDVLLWKEGGTTLAQKSESTSCTHRSNGLYTCPLNTTDTNTLGILSVNVAESGALPVRHDYNVVPAMIYDSLIGGTDTLDAQVTGMGSGVLTAAAIAGDAITAAKLASDVTTELQSGLATASALATVAGYIDTEVASILAAVDTEVAAIKAVTDKLDDTLEDQGGGTYGFTEEALQEAPTGGGSDVFVLRDNTAQGGDTDSIILDSGASSTNDVYKSNVVFLNGGTGAGQSRYISGYNGTTKVATVEPAFVIAPDNTTGFVIAPFGTDPATIETLVTEIWAAQRSEHQVAGSFGERVNADMTHLAGNSTAAENLKDTFLTAPAAIAADVQFVNGVELEGDGTDANPWRAIGT